MKRIYQIFIFIPFLCLIFLLNTTIYAAQPLKLGENEIIPWGDIDLQYDEEDPLIETRRRLEKPGLTPWAEIKVQYDDNVFLSPSNKKDDFIVTLSPGVSYRQPFQDNLLKLDYHAEINKYIDQTSQDATNHFLSGELDINWRDISFRFYDDFKRVFEYPSVEDTERVKRDDNSTGIAARLHKDRLGIQLGYEHFIRNYRASAAYEIYDRRDDIYSLILTHQTFPKTGLLFEYDFGQIRYDESTRSDSDYHQFLIGAIEEVTAKTMAAIKAGYQLRDYEVSGEPSFASGVVYADMIHKFSDKNSLKVSLLRTAHESTYVTNNFYTAENVSTVFDHFFTPKLLGFLTGVYQINSYPEETTEGDETMKRKDKYYALGAGLRYYLKRWLSLTLKAEHIIRDSNFDFFEYNKNLITFSARAVF